MDTLPRDQSPAPSRRSRHSKSQSTSALSAMLDMPRQRSSIPPVPEVPYALRSPSKREARKKHSSRTDGRMSTLPGLMDSSDLSDGGSSTTNSYDSPTTSKGSYYSVSQSRTFQSLADPGSPTPTRTRAKAAVKDDSDDPLPLADQPLSPTKRRSVKDREDGLMDLGIQRKPSRRRGEARSPKKDGLDSRTISGESTRVQRQVSVKEETEGCTKLLESHRTQPDVRLQTLQRLEGRLAGLAPSRLPLTEKTRGDETGKMSDLETFVKSGVHQALLDLLFRHAAVLPHLPQMLPQRVGMLQEIQLVASLLQGICLLEGFVSIQDGCRASLSETRVLEILVDLLRFVDNDRLARQITPSLLDLVYSIIASPAPRADMTGLSTIARFVKVGGTEVLEELMRSNQQLGMVAYDLTKFIAIGIIESHGTTARRKVSTDRSTSEGSFESMTTGRSGTSERGLMTPVTDESDGRSSRASSIDVDNTPRTPRKRDTAERVAPATTHSSSKSRLLPKSATSSALSGFYTPSARGEKRHFNRGTREDGQKLGRVLEEDTGGLPQSSTRSRLAVDPAPPGSPTIEDFASDLDDTMHSTIRGKLDVFGLPEPRPSERVLPRTRSTMGAEIVSRSSPSKGGIGRGLPSGMAVDSPRRTSAGRVSGMRSGSGEMGIRPGSRLKKSSTMASLQVEGD